MDRKKFRQFLHENFNITENVIMDRIFKHFNKVANDNIDQEEWVIGFNIFMKGSTEEMTRFCFDIYDLNEDGYIRYVSIISQINQSEIVGSFQLSKEEMMLLLKDCMYKHVKEPTDEEGDDGVKV